MIFPVNFQFKQLESFQKYFITSLLSQENMNSQLTSLPMCGFIAQLVEHRTGIAEVTGSNPVEVLIFFRLLYSNCLNWKFTAKITYHIDMCLQFIYESFHIHYIKTKLEEQAVFGKALLRFWKTFQPITNSHDTSCNLVSFLTKTAGPNQMAEMRIQPKEVVVCQADSKAL